MKQRLEVGKLNYDFENAIHAVYNFANVSQDETILENLLLVSLELVSLVLQLVRKHHAFYV